MITLTQEELDLIETSRKEKLAKEIEQLEIEAYRMEAVREFEAKRAIQVNRLQQDLLALDTDNILTLVDGELKVQIGPNIETVNIEEHHTSRYGSWRSSNQGYKYLLSFWSNEHSQRYYKRPQTVLAKLKEYRHAADLKAKLKKAKASLKDRAMAELHKMYPEFTIGFFEGRSSTKYSRYKPDLIVVESPNGSYEFTFYEDADTKAITYGVWGRKIGKSIESEVHKLILGDVFPPAK